MNDESLRLSHFTGVTVGQLLTAPALDGLRGMMLDVCFSTFMGIGGDDIHCRLAARLEKASVPRRHRRRINLTFLLRR